MHRIFHIKAYEKEHGPHFNEEHARKAVMKMENEDGTRGPHWSIEETTTLASQYGITLQKLQGRLKRIPSIIQVELYLHLRYTMNHYHKGSSQCLINLVRK